MADVSGRILDRAGAVYNVRHPDFAADATGATDATEAIQEALDAAAADGGGTVVIPAGTYAVGNPGAAGTPTPLVVASRIRLVITEGATLKAATIVWTDRGVIEVPHTSTDVVIEGGGTIDGQRALNSDGRIFGVYVRGARRVRVRDLYVKDMPANPSYTQNPAGNGGDGIVIGNNHPNVQLSEEVTVESVTVSNVGRSAFSVIAGRNVTFTGCTALNTTGQNPGTGLDVEPDPGLGAYGISVVGCHFSGNNIGVATSRDATGVTISGCTFANNRGYDFIGRGNGVTFVGNTVDVMARGAQVYTADQKILNGPGPDDDTVIYHTRSCRIIGNTFLGKHRETERAGVIAWDAEDLLIFGNEFRDIAGPAIMLDQRAAAGAKLQSRRVNISANQVVDCVGAGVAFTGAIQLLMADVPGTQTITELTLRDNSVHDSRGAPGAADFGIQASNIGAAQRATWHVSDNIVTGIGAPLSGISQLGNVLVQTATVAFPSVPANDSATVDVTIAGAATGDGVTVMPLASLGTKIVIAFAHVTAADTVRVQVFNHGAAAQAAQNVSCKFSVIKS